MVSLLHFQWSLRNGERKDSRRGRERDRERGRKEVGEREREWTVVNKWYFHCNSFSLVETRRESCYHSLPFSPPSLFCHSFLRERKKEEKERRKKERRERGKRKGDQCPILVQPGRETWTEGRGKGIKSIKTSFPLIPMGSKSCRRRPGFLIHFLQN